MSYEVNGVKYDSWSVKNQKIIDMLVNREVYCCMTSEVEYMISRIPFNDDDNPFEESDYDKMMVPYCSECESSYGFEELTVADLKDDDFLAGEGLNDESGEIEDGFLCPVCGYWHKTIAEARKCCGEDTTAIRLSAKTNTKILILSQRKYTNGGLLPIGLEKNSRSKAVWLLKLGVNHIGAEVQPVRALASTVAS